MMAVFGPRKRALSVLCAGIFCAAAFAGAARADTFDIELDQARVMKLPDKVATIVIGNPLIADAALQAGGLLVITGKGYGATNLLALDRTGRIIMDTMLQVSSPNAGNLVTVYRGIDREVLQLRAAMCRPPYARRWQYLLRQHPGARQCPQQRRRGRRRFRLCGTGPLIKSAQPRKSPPSRGRDG